MLVQQIQESQPAHVVVLASEKGGSGKSTTALHIAVALLKAGQRVATVRNKGIIPIVYTMRHADDVDPNRTGRSGIRPPNP
jgi:ATPase MipZ